MSLDKTGRTIRCDGSGPDGESCARTARNIVALRPNRAQRQESTGWLFIKDSEADWHYCPACAPLYLSEYLSPAGTGITAAVNVTARSKGV